MSQTTAFTLNARLAADTEHIGNLPLCALLWMNDARFPWCILVPRVADMREMIDLTSGDAEQLFRESLALQRALRELFRPDKLNVAAIGNLVPQLHLHHIARYTTDSEWPAPVWGRGVATSYDPQVRAQHITQLRAALHPLFQHHTPS